MSLSVGLGQIWYAKNCFNMKWIKSYNQALLESSNQDELDKRLLAAAEKGDIEEVRNLLDRGAEVDSRNRGGETPLHKAAKNGHIEVARLLLDRGARIDAVDGFKMTPLHWAAWSGRSGVAILLLYKGARVDAEDHFKRAPLYKAVDHGHRETAKLFILHGEDPTKAFNSMEVFNGFFGGDLSWYEGDLDELERRFKANLIRKKLF